MTDSFMATYRRTGLCLERGKGAIVTAQDGREYIDFTSGIGVNSLGHAHPELMAAILDQVGKIMHTSNYYMNPESADLSNELCAASGMDKVFLCNSGAEANECAIKMARKHGSSRSPGKTDVITLKGSFHGRTVTTLAATGQEKFHVHFGPFPKGFKFVTPGDLPALEAAIDDGTAAFLFEPIQGEGGVIPLGRDYLLAAEALCRKRGILFIADEIQTGMGRTGSLFASDSLGLKPDIITTAKGLGGGIPIGAVLARGEAAAILSSGDHGSTFGGNPLASRAARTVLSVLLRDGFYREVSRKGHMIKDTIAEWNHPLVKEIRGEGLMIGIAVRGKPADVQTAAMELGLLVLTAGEDAVRFLPPLVITDDQVRSGLTLFRAALDKADKI